MPQTFSTISTMRKYVLIRLTTYYGQPCFSQFCHIIKGERSISTGSVGLQVPGTGAKFLDLVIDLD